jgi:ABC-2 type transport system permease protein
VWFFVIVAAIIASAGEFQHGTIRTTVLLTPRRSELLAIKSLATACFGAMVVAAGIVIAVSAGILTSLIAGLSVSAGSAADVAHLVAAAALGALWSVLATALGMITRSTAIAIAALLLWRFVGEALLPVLFSPHGEQILRWTPTGTARTLIGSAGLPLAAAATVLVGYAVVLCSVAAVQFTRAEPS